MNKSDDPTTMEGFWAYELDSFIPRGLINIRDFCKIGAFLIGC